MKLLLLSLGREVHKKLFPYQIVSSLIMTCSHNLMQPNEIVEDPEMIHLLSLSASVISHQHVSETLEMLLYLHCFLVHYHFLPGRSKIMNFKFHKSHPTDRTHQLLPRRSCVKITLYAPIVSGTGLIIKTAESCVHAQVSLISH